MRKPKSAKSSASDAPPAGGRALGRAQQFTYSRGLPAPVVDSAPAVKKPAAAKKSAAKKVAAKGPAKKTAKT